MGYGEEETEKSPSSPTTAATAELPGEDRPEEDNGSRHEPSPSWPTRLADFRRMAANQAAQAKSNASENRRARRLASLAPSSSSAAAATTTGNTTHGETPSNDTTAFSAFPNTITPAHQRRVYTAAIAEASEEDSQPEFSEYEDSPEEDDGSELEPYPSGPGLSPESSTRRTDMRARWDSAGYWRRWSRMVVDTQTAIASFEASEDRRRATRFARLARSPAAAVGAGNTSDVDAPSNDTTASSVSPNPIAPAVERRVYTPADLREIGNTTLSVTPASSLEGWERVRLRYPPTLFNYHNANLDGSSDIRDDSNPPPLTAAATGEPSHENSQPQESAHEDSTPEADGRVRSLSPSLSPESSARCTDTRAPWLDEDQIRTADVAAVAQRGRASISDAERREWLRRSGSPAPSSTAGAAGALDSQGSAEGGEESSEEP
jgi:hypothetical protein